MSKMHKYPQNVLEIRAAVNGALGEIVAHCLAIREAMGPGGDRGDIEWRSCDLKNAMSRALSSIEAYLEPPVEGKESDDEKTWWQRDTKS